MDRLLFPWAKSTLESSYTENEMDKERSSGKMVQSTRGPGRTIKQMVKEASTMQMVILTRENGLMIRRMGMGRTSIRMERILLENGTMIDSKGMALRLGLMVLCTKARTTKGRSTALVISNSLMVVRTLGSFQQMKYKELGNTSGSMAKCIKENGTKTK